MFENSYKTNWVNTSNLEKPKRKLNIEELDGIFPQDKFDVTFYLFESYAIPNFHVETRDVDMVFSINDGNFIRHASEPKSMEDANYIFNNFMKWYDESKRNKCINAWFYIQYEFHNYFYNHRKNEEFPIQLTCMGPSFWINLRSIDKVKSKENLLDKVGPFLPNQFDITVYDMDEGTPRFHVENMNVDLVFSIENGSFIFKNGKTFNEDTEKYVLENISEWYLKNKNRLENAWIYSHSGFSSPQEELDFRNILWSQISQMRS